MYAAAAEALGIDAQHVLVCSTGIIGNPLPMDKILPAVPKLARKLSKEGGEEAAKGILTTDHVQ
jgi:glutamate N-acetyltransferase/amino-acid N-acetyltransferase